MTPIPLTLPDGTIHAWACSQCKFVQASHQGRAWCYADAEHTRREAEHCCTCRTCRAPVEIGTWECSSCEAKDRARRDASAAIEAANIAAIKAADSERWRAWFWDGAKDVEIEVRALQHAGGYSAYTTVEGVDYNAHHDHVDATRAVVKLCDEVMYATEWSLRNILPP